MREKGANGAVICVEELKRVKVVGKFGKEEKKKEKEIKKNKEFRRQETE